MRAPVSFRGVYNQVNRLCSESASTGPPIPTTPLDSGLRRSDYWRRHQHRNATHRREHDRHHRGHRAGAERHVRHLRPGRRRRALLPRRRAPRAILRQAVGEPRAGPAPQRAAQRRGRRRPGGRRGVHREVRQRVLLLLRRPGPVPSRPQRRRVRFAGRLQPASHPGGLPRAERPREVPRVRTGRGGRGGQHRGRLRVLGPGRTGTTAGSKTRA